jgi:hypothetical protein
LETAIEKLFEQHNLSQEYLCEARKQQQVVTIDLDLSGQPASKDFSLASMRLQCKNPS